MYKTGDYVTYKENGICRIAEETENSQYTWIEDSKARAEYFNKLLRSGDKAAVLWLVKALSLHKIEVEKKKRSFYASDKRILAAAEKVITEEFAFVLGIAPEEVIPYIVNKLHAV